MLISALRRRTALFLGVLGIALALALLVTTQQQRRYTATSEVVLDVTERQAASPDAGGGANTEVQVIRSRGMARAVAGALRLDRDPAFVGGGGAGSGLRRLIGLGGAAVPLPASPAEATRRAVDRLLAGLAVSHLDQTYSLTISYTATNARDAARIANAYARLYSEAKVASDRRAGRVAAGEPERTNARIISEAEPPLSPSAPRPLRNLALALAIGTVLGVLAALAAERMFAGLTSGGDVEDRLGLRHLGSVPMLASVLPKAASAVDAMVDSPMSGFAEAFRGVMVAIREAGGGARVIAITSALPNEGKTTIAACLARSVALGGEAVVLVDCDTRRHDIRAMFPALARRPGLAEVLRDEATLDEALVRDTASGAWVLPLTGPPAEMSDLLGGAAMIALIEALRKRFARVLIDTAPVLAIAETRLLAPMVDLVVIVVRWRATADHAVKAALRLLPEEGVKIAGVVLSRVDIRKQVRYAHGDPAFYYRQYSKYYSS